MTEKKLAIIKNIKMYSLFSDLHDTKKGYLMIMCDEKDLTPSDDFGENGLCIALDTLDKALNEIHYLSFAFTDNINIKDGCELTVELGKSIMPSEAFSWREITKIVDFKRN